MGSKKEKNYPPKESGLRRPVKEKPGSVATGELASRAEGEPQRLVHEPKGHRDELELQNEELPLAMDEAVESCDNYSDPHDFVPVGYFTLDREGKIRAANLTGASLLVTNHSRLIGRHFNTFLSPEDRPSFILFLEKVLSCRDMQACEVALRDTGKHRLHLHIEAVACEAAQQCSLAVIDVTGRRRSEETRAFLATIIESSDDAIIAMDLDGLILSWNKGSERLFGYRAVEIIGKSITLLLPPGLQVKEEQFLLRLQAGERIEHFETKRITRDGIQLDMSVSASPIRNDQGLTIGVATIARDITGRKRAESLVKAQFRILAASNLPLADMLQVVVDEIEAQTGSGIGFFHFFDADQETLSLQKWSTSTLANMCSADGEGSHYPVSHAGVWVDCIHERRPVIHNDYGALPHRKGMPPGHAPVIREMVIPIVRGERIVAIIGVGNKATDYDPVDVDIASLLGDFSWEIVERKIAEESLRRSEHQLAMAQAIAHIGSWEWDSVSDKITGSDEFNRIFGQPLSTYDSFLELVHPDDRETVNRAVRETLSHQAPYNVHYRINCPDGTCHVIHAQGAAVTDNAGKTVALLGTCQDVSERTEMEEKLKIQNAELEARAEELKAANCNHEAFSAAVSHDLRAYLNNIYGFCQVLQLEECASQVDKGCRDHIMNIKQGCEGMTRLIDTLLTFFRISKTDIHMSEVSLTNMASGIATELKGTAPERECSFRIMADVSTFGDPSLLRVVLANLLGNAWKYTAREKQAVIQFGMTEKEGRAVYFVRDNGVGFDMAKAGKLFTPFHRLHNRERFDGHGIGLATVERIISRHGGKIWAESKPDRGATFYFTLAEG